MTSATHSFSVELACKLESTDLALVINHFIHWIGVNKRKGSNFIDNRTWTYDTQKDIAAHFPYYTERQVKYYIEVLCKRGILVKGNHNKSAFDKTNWYAFVDESEWSFSKNVYERQNEPIAVKDSESSNNVYERRKCLMGETKVSNGESQSVRPIPVSLPYSKTQSLIDHGQKTMACDKSKEKTMDISKRYCLTPEQTEIYEYLLSLKINTTRQTLAYWAKTYSMQRLIDVYNESKHNGGRNLGGYMQSLLKDKKVVHNASIEANSMFMKDFMKDNKWHGPKIHKKYAKIPMGRDFIEIDLNMNPFEFIQLLIEKYENYKTQ